MTETMERRARQVVARACQIDCELMRRPGATAPGEWRDALTMLNDTVRGIPGVMLADPDRQVETGLSFLRLWQSVLTDQADCLWADSEA